MKYLPGIICLLTLLSIESKSLPGQQKTQMPPVYSTKDGAIGGYDPVAYFTDNVAVPGNDTITSNWKSAQWKFSSDKNRRMFVADPQKFAPQYGGYCAFGMSNNYKAPTSPDAWTVIDGKLYLNYNKQVQQKWKTETGQRIARADSNWIKF